ncbi:COP23 domain-containing protein [Brasilonema sp. UFV-L1]|uniref:COP23 domain-containing protein n=1 Tax=Brasilonema sp. UFV-L1 TaxID=2234130 RepID=UPI002006E492|nr:COP23 domain-containing protein [Brasilonema sp. UFV-L1]
MSSQVLTWSVRVFSIATLTTLATTATLNQLTYAESPTFYCGKSNGVPTTFVRTQDGKNLPVIRWVSDYFSGTGLTPQQRCQQVSRRFQRSYDHDTLKHIKPGMLKGQPVVCAVAEKNAACTDTTLLFTLKPGSDPDATARQLFDRRALAAGNVTNQIGGDTSNDSVIIDFEAYLYFSKN